MAMATGGGGDDAVCEINVTPMVDVLLCLLIIFMVASPKPPNEKLDINLPKDSITEMPSDPNATILVKVTTNGSAMLGTQPLSSDYDTMVSQFAANPKATGDDKVIVTGEPQAPYGAIIRVMTAAHEAGIAQVGIASERL